MGQRPWQDPASGLAHLRARVLYGNNEVFARFACATLGSFEELAPIGTESALAVLRLQQAVVDRQERWGRNSG